MLKIIQVAVEKLIPYANNARTHSETQVAQIAKSITQFGFNNPVLIDDNFNVIAGHGRLLAAASLGLESAPAVILSHLSEEQKRAYIIADNKLALNAGWNDELLKLEIESLKTIDVDLLGFSQDELKIILDGWNPNIEISDDKDFDDRPFLKYRFEKGSQDLAKEVITNALDLAGIDYEQV